MSAGRPTGLFPHGSLEKNGANPMSIGVQPEPAGVTDEHLARRYRPMEQLFNVGVFGLFAVLWVAFAVGLIWSQGSLDQTWESIRGLPIVVQAVVWLLFLPVVAGLWVWESTWPVIVRLVLVAGIGFWNLYIFFPRSMAAVRP
jgi:hypothetical protein